MKISVIKGRQIDPDLAGIWTRIHQSVPELASPYFHPEFTRAVADVRDDVFVSVVEEAGEPIAFFPFQRGPMRAGRPVGGPLSDCHGIIARGAIPLPATDLLRASGLASWSFDHCPASQVIFAPYQLTRSKSPVMELSAGYEEYAAARRREGSKQILKTEGLARKLEREVGPLRFTPSVADPAALRQCIDWKRSHYAEMGVKDIFGVNWTGALLHRILAAKQPGFAGILSTLHAGDRLIAVHMGMRSHSVWHYWFPTYDREASKFSPGIILLLRMAEAAQGLGVRSIDLGKGETLYKDRLASDAVALIEGRISLPSLASSLFQFRQASERWIRCTPFGKFARYPGHIVKRTEKWLRFR